MALLDGFGLGMGLIVAIGAQNMFVLRQGLRRKYMFVTALICSVSDAVLILFGIYGFGAIVVRYPELITALTWGAASIVFFYGIISFRSSFSSISYHGDSPETNLSWQKIVLTTLAFTWLNPHVYLDTVVLVGSIGVQYEDVNRFLFAIGAMSASIIWFFGLVYGAARLAPLFRNPLTWRILDSIVGIVMWWISYSLIAKII